MSEIPDCSIKELALNDLSLFRSGFIFEKEDLDFYLDRKDLSPYLKQRIKKVIKIQQGEANDQGV